MSALYANKTGIYNSASGSYALYSNTKGGYNTASGAGALYYNTTGSMNVAVGFDAASTQKTGSSNTAVGFHAGLAWSTGSNNIAVGALAGSDQTAGSDNIAIGARGAAGDNGVIRIGTMDVHGKTFIAGIRNTTLSGGLAVLVNADGKLGVATSSRRYKQNIQPMGDASNRLLELRPVTFEYKQAEEDGSHPLQYGLIAEDVAAVMPELAVYNEDGTPESVAYQVLPSLLLNEYQKQAKELADTRAELAGTKAKFETLEAELADLKLTVSRLAAAPSATQLASGD